MAAIMLLGRGLSGLGSTSGQRTSFGLMPSGIPLLYYPQSKIDIDSECRILLYLFKVSIHCNWLMLLQRSNLRSPQRKQKKKEGRAKCLVRWQLFPHGQTKVGVWILRVGSIRWLGKNWSSVPPSEVIFQGLDLAKGLKPCLNSGVFAGDFSDSGHLRPFPHIFNLGFVHSQ